MMRAVEAKSPGSRVTGVLLQQQAGSGREFIVGLSRSEGFGALIMFGLGGVLVEALGDVVFRLAPVDDVQARDMMASIRGVKLLYAFRGEPAVDRAALSEVLRRIAQLGADFPEIVELDANPVLASERGSVAVDCRVRLSTP
jgi:acyl-CoA synthetase (NDP forming)